MSRDIFVQDIPSGLANVEDIPGDWEPSLLAFGHDDVVRAVRAAASEGAVVVSDPEWLQVEFSGVNLAANVSHV